jgi:hypothetical protein
MESSRRQAKPLMQVADLIGWLFRTKVGSPGWHTAYGEAILCDVSQQNHNKNASLARLSFRHSGRILRN